MDPATYNNFVNYKSNGGYPVGLTKDEKKLFRKKAINFVVEGEARLTSTLSLLIIPLLIGLKLSNHYIIYLHDYNIYYIIL